LLLNATLKTLKSGQHLVKVRTRVTCLIYNCMMLCTRQSFFLPEAISETEGDEGNLF